MPTNLQKGVEKQKKNNYNYNDNIVLFIGESIEKGKRNRKGTI